MIQINISKLCLNIFTLGTRGLTSEYGGEAWKAEAEKIATRIENYLKKHVNKSQLLIIKNLFQLQTENIFLTYVT